MYSCTDDNCVPYALYTTVVEYNTRKGSWFCTSLPLVRHFPINHVIVKHKIACAAISHHESTYKKQSMVNTLLGSGGGQNSYCSDISHRGSDLYKHHQRLQVFCTLIGIFDVTHHKPRHPISDESKYTHIKLSYMSCNCTFVLPYILHARLISVLDSMGHERYYCVSHTQSLKKAVLSKRMKVPVDIGL